MPRHTEQRVLPYTPEQLFDLVADTQKFDDNGRGGIRLQAALCALGLLLPEDASVP